MTSATAAGLPAVLIACLLDVMAFLPASCSSDDVRIVAVCQSDYFRAKCAWDELIVVTHAEYGRMRINYKCVSENFGYVGCSDDVTSVIDRYCSGRRSCHVRVLDETFPDAQPCHDDLNSYLEVEYHCVRALTAERYDCGPTLPPIDLLSISPSAEPVYLALGNPSTPAGLAVPSPTAADQITHPVVVDSESTNTSITSLLSISQRQLPLISSSACGQPDYPWILSVKPGQRLTVTLIDFDLLPPTSALPLSSSFPLATGNGSRGSLAQRAPAPPSAVIYSDFCSGGQRSVYAIIGERDIGLNVTVCGGPVVAAATSALHSDNGNSGDIESDAWNFNDDYHGSWSRIDASAEKLVRRERIIYESVGHVIEIRLPRLPPSVVGAGFGGRSTFHQPRQRRYGFIFRLDVVGCPDVEAPTGGWAFRNDDTTATFGCSSETMASTKTWQLVCLGRIWRGIVHNCTVNMPDGDGLIAAEDELNNTYLSAGALAMVATGLALALCLSVVVARQVLDPACDLESCGNDVTAMDNDVNTTGVSSRQRRRHRDDDSRRSGYNAFQPLPLSNTADQCLLPTPCGSSRSGLPCGCQPITLQASSIPAPATFSGIVSPSSGLHGPGVIAIGNFDDV